MSTTELHDDVATSIALGFSLSGEVDLKPAKQRYSEFAEDVQLKSIQNLVVLTEDLAKRAGDPDVTLRTLLDIADFNFKVSGMAAKNAKEATPTGGGAYQLFINFSGTSPKETFTGVTIEHAPQVQAQPQINANI
jgi:hypothetical protein